MKKSVSFDSKMVEIFPVERTDTSICQELFYQQEIIKNVRSKVMCAPAKSVLRRRTRRTKAERVKHELVVQKESTLNTEAGSSIRASRWTSGHSCVDESPAVPTRAR